MAMTNLFERLSRERPTPNKKAHQLESAQKLLDWLMVRWNKPTIRARDIHYCGPNSLRNKKRAIKHAGILVEHGWLTPVRGRQYNTREWLIIRKPVLHPTIEKDA
jgi:hypothetical protein